MIQNEVKECFDSLNEVCKIRTRDVLTPCLRILSGSVNVTKISNNTEYELDACYFPVLKEIDREKRASSFFQSINEGMTEADYEKFATKIGNRKFFIALKDELVNFSINQREERYTNAFVHMYRMIEYISYVFPMLYATSAEDFQGTFRVLRNFFSEKNNTAELDFFRKFLEHSIDETIKEVQIEYNFCAENEDLQRSMYELAKSKIWKGSPCEESSEGEKLVLKWIDVPGMVICIRNAFFHYANGIDNTIASAQMPDSDLFFSSINESTMSWFACLFSEVLEKMYELRFSDEE